LYALDLLAMGEGEDRLPVYIYGLIEMKTGVIVDYALTTVKPGITDALSLLDNAKHLQSTQRPHILLSSIDLPQTPSTPTTAILDKFGMRFNGRETGPSWPGRAWTATFGRRLGRIPLCRRQHRKVRKQEAVPLGYVQGAVAVLVERANSRNKSIT
jgi:hypothetical protein